MTFGDVVLMLALGAALAPVGGLVLYAGVRIGARVYRHFAKWDVG